MARWCRKRLFAGLGYKVSHLKCRRLWERRLYMLFVWFTVSQRIWLAHLNLSISCPISTRLSFFFHFGYQSLWEKIQKSPISQVVSIGVNWPACDISVRETCAWTDAKTKALMGGLCNYINWRRLILPNTPVGHMCTLIVTSRPGHVSSLLTFESIL